MKHFSHRLTLVLFPALMCVLLGCSGQTNKDGKDGKEGKDGKNAGSGAVGADDLKFVAEALIRYSDEKDKGPTKLDDLAPYLEKTGKALGQIRSGAIVVIWGVSINDLSKKPGRSPAYVIAYEKGAPTSGGLVAMGNGEVKKVTAAEFKGLKLAGPGK